MSLSPRVNNMSRLKLSMQPFRRLVLKPFSDNPPPRVTICIRKDLFKDKGHYGLYDTLHMERLTEMYTRLVSQPVNWNSHYTHRLPFIVPKSIYYYSENQSTRWNVQLSNIESMIALRLENFQYSDNLQLHSYPKPDSMKKLRRPEYINTNVSTFIQHADLPLEPTKNVIVSSQIPLHESSWLTFGQILDNWFFLDRGCSDSNRVDNQFILDVAQASDNELGIQELSETDEEWIEICKWANKNGP